jgi:PAS domain S-box-containing protein
MNVSVNDKDAVVSNPVGEALQYSSNHLRLVIDTIPAFVWSATPDGSIEFLNKRGLDYTGFTLEQLRGWNWKDSNILHPDDIQGLFETWSAIVASGQPGEVQARMRRFDGEYRWFLFRVAPLRDQSGRLIAWWGVDLDIHDRIQAEDKLRQSETYLAEAQRLSHTGSFGWNVATGALVWSEETFCILGYDRTIKPTLELVFKRIHPDDITFVRQTLDHATQHKANLDFENRLLMPDGSAKRVRVLAQPAKTAEGALQFVGALMDITEQKRLENRLRESEKNLAEGQRLTKTGSWVLDYPTGNTDWSVETCRIFGFPDPPPSPHYTEFRARVRPEDREAVDRGLRESFETGEPRPLEYIFVLPDGVGKNIETISQPVRDETGTVVKLMGTVMDVTERKQTAEALRASDILARGQLEALTSTLAVITQETKPEKFLEHVLRVICQQLGANGVSVWEMDRKIGCIHQVASFEENTLRLPTPDKIQLIPQEGLGASPHPVWSDFFRDGNFCVYCRIDANPLRVLVAKDPNGPWHDNFAVSVPNLPGINVCQRLSFLGVKGTLIIPMLVAGKVTGFFSTRFDRMRSFRQEEIELTRAMSHQAMLAIQLIRLSQLSRETAVVAERNRMARDIHDTLAQGFTGIIMQLEAAKGAAAQGNPAEVADRISRADELARSSLEEARRSVRALRPRALRDGRLSMALQDLLKRMTEGTGLNADFKAEGDERRIPTEYEEGLLRITQESLTNTIKHANARIFTATLNVSEGKIRLQLVDDGRGFDSQAESDGFGLIGMKERVDQMGGQFIFRSKLGVGTEILVVLINKTAQKPENGNEQA